MKTMKPKIKTRLANLIAKLAGSGDYDPNVKPITPLEFYLEQYISEPVPIITMTNGAFFTGEQITIENAELLVSRIVAHQQVIIKYQQGVNAHYNIFNCETTDGIKSIAIVIGYYRKDKDGNESKVTGTISYNKITRVLTIKIKR